MGAVNGQHLEGFQESIGAVNGQHLEGFQESNGAVNGQHLEGFQESIGAVQSFTGDTTIAKSVAASAWIRGRPTGPPLLAGSCGGAHGGMV